MKADATESMLSGVTYLVIERAILDPIATRMVVEIAGDRVQR